MVLVGYFLLFWKRKRRERGRTALASVDDDPEIVVGKLHPTGIFRGALISLFKLGARPYKTTITDESSTQNMLIPSPFLLAASDEQHFVKPKPSVMQRRNSAMPETTLASAEPFRVANRGQIIPNYHMPSRTDCPAAGSVPATRGEIEGIREHLRSIEALLVNQIGSSSGGQPQDDIEGGAPPPY